MQLMVQVGLMTPDGQLVGPPMASGGEPALIMPGAGGEKGKLWTPDAPQASGEKKSALWIPD
jgi:hypothetical protein